jgi:mRNA-degrading endonuclease RelE of RelBE toxin-antitoxin system
VRASLIFLFILGLSTASTGQKTVNKFIDQIKKHDSALAMTLPGWFIRSGINLATKGIEDQDEKEIINLGKKVKKLRFVVVDKPHHITQEDSAEFLQKVKDKEGFEEYTRVRDGGTRVYVLVKEDKNKIKYLMIYARGENNIALINLKTDLTFDELENANFSWKNKEKIEVETSTIN